MLQRDGKTIVIPRAPFRIDLVRPIAKPQKQDSLYLEYKYYFTII